MYSIKDIEKKANQVLLSYFKSKGRAIEMPIDPISWDEEFQEDEEMAPAEEDGLLPGFVFMSALATMSLAAVYLPSKDESEDI